MPSSSADFLHAIRQVFEQHVALYCERDLRFAACFSADFSGLPPDGNTFLRDRDAWIEALLHDYQQVPGPLGMQVLDWDAQPLGGEMCLITALCRVQRPQRDKRGALEAGPTMRWVQLLRREEGTWKILHHSTSVATPSPPSGPLGAAAPRNGWLQWLDWLRPASAAAGRPLEDKIQPPTVNKVPSDASENRSTTDALGSALPTSSGLMPWPARYAALEAAYIQSELHAQHTIAHLRSTDIWTGLGSRSLWDTALPTAWQRALREGCQLGLVVLELDQWWDFRARHGQLAADRCVQAVAVVLQQSSPDVKAPSALEGSIHPVQSDSQRAHADQLVGASAHATQNDQRTASPWCPIRLADDRFALLLHGASLADAMAQAQQWHRAVAALAVPHRAREGAVVTASVAAASMQPVRGIAPDDLLRSADIALQHAVQAGGNQVVNTDQAP